MGKNCKITYISNLLISVWYLVEYVITLGPIQSTPLLFIPVYTMHILIRVGIKTKPANHKLAHNAKNCEVFEFKN